MQVDFQHIQLIAKNLMQHTYHLVNFTLLKCVIISEQLASSLASSPHPLVSGLVMTVCACVDFPRKTWGKCRQFRYHRLLSATVRRLSLLERQVVRLKKSKHARYATYTMATWGKCRCHRIRCISRVSADSNKLRRRTVALSNR